MAGLLSIISFIATAGSIYAGERSRRAKAKASKEYAGRQKELGQVAGQTIDHVHIHVIPRYSGDMDDPTGGVRHVIPGKGKY